MEVRRQSDLFAFQAHDTTPVRDMLGRMQLFKKLLDSLSAPFYAITMHSDYEPKDYHPQAWFLIFLTATVFSFVSEWIGWHWAGWDRIIYFAIACNLICRLGSVEYSVKH